ncbi:hypothetical protein D3C72_1851950 [compost metagenome]
MYPVAGVAGAAVLSSGRGQFGMIPDGDVKHIADTDTVLITLQTLVQCQVWSRYRLNPTHFLQQHRRNAVHLDLFIQIKVFVLLSHCLFAMGRQV